MKNLDNLLGLVPLGALVLATACSEAAKDPFDPQFAKTGSTTSVTFTGQGLIADGFGGYDLVTELCGIENGAEVDGPYILWVFTASGAESATITGPWGTGAMTKFGNGTFKYISGWYDPSTLPTTVVATANVAVKNPQLVVSHGCRPFTQGAWCSPGFWMNATDGAWTLIGHSKTEFFNSTVYDVWYGATFTADPTLYTVLNTNGGTYKKAPVPGTSGYALNAFNAVGAYLTNFIPGYQYDWDVMMAGSDDACPIDHFGNFKD